MSATGGDRPPNEDHARFTSALERLLSAKDRSHVWSPYSVGSVLALLAEGAAGRTREELTALLAPVEGDPSAHLASLDAAVESADGLDLAVLNGLYVPDDLRPYPGFEKAVRARAGAEVERVDFRGASEEVRRSINGRVSEVTRGIIDELLAPGTVHPDVRMMLVNALRVKMVWRDPFEVGLTGQRRFHTPRGARKVPTMHRSGRMPYAERDGWRMVSLAGEYDLALDVFLGEGDTPPDHRTSRALYEALRPERVDLALPRFAVESDLSLLEPLADDSIGVRTLATDEADFSGIADARLKVDTIVHQSVLRVDERGAEGAAATAAVMLTAALPTKAKRFVVDRPFGFALRRGEAVLFTGRVVDPVDPGPAS
ncbi:serpin family protein [Nocardiopsis alba]|uniref:Proteinase inhibitor I4, serpin n=1 Tax=Nocardiopsis alba (strain ATCC BAA-2165 / BE74) TaxID=1205910 RepID=J7L897_NOCAA|nr:serpin family protein [Nocardiopsis alba]AFR06682.1 proteinase inhibitor I4, serpin [Nocardiopsis alba ATCC BAA-2165]